MWATGEPPDVPAGATVVGVPGDVHLPGSDRRPEEAVDPAVWI